MRLSAIDLNLLPYLHALLEEGSVSAAAKSVGLSPTAMSHALARLRVLLEDDLLVRSGRSMVLTERAESLRGRVQKTIEDVRATMRPLGPLEPSRLERLFRVRTSDHVVHLAMAGMDEWFRAAPKATLQFLPIRADDAEVLRSGSIDLAIGVYRELPPEIRRRDLFHDKFVVLVRSGHDLLKEPLTAERYAAASHIQVATRGRPGGVIDNRLQALGHTRHIAIAVPYFQTALELASTSNHLVTISKRLADRYAARLGLEAMVLPIEMWGYTVEMIWHPRHDGDPAHAWLRKGFIEAIAFVDREG